MHLLILYVSGDMCMYTYIYVPIVVQLIYIYNSSSMNRTSVRNRLCTHIYVVSIVMRIQHAYIYIHIVSIYIKCICRQLGLHIYVICICFYILVHGMVHRTEQTQMHKKEICNTHCLDAIKNNNIEDTLHHIR